MTDFPSWLTRRAALGAGACLTGLAALRPFVRGVRAEDAGEIESHGLSTFGDLAQAPGFQAFPYVNPDAPKGGAISQEMQGTFDSLNGFILRGNPAVGLGLVFDSLMAASLDERDAYYGLVAKSVRVSADKLGYRFLLRREARFHDGSPLTARDVAFSLNILKEKGHPTISQELRDMASAVAEADDVLVVRLAPTRTRELPLIIVRQPIFSAAYYAKRDFDETTLEAPLGSGGYKVGAFEQGRFITYERVPEYWGKDLPVNAGQGNFDTVKFLYFGDRNVAFEAFKAGAFTEREEFTAAVWATGYDFPAFRDGRVKREEIPDENISGIQGWFFNTRRKQLADPRVREAIGYAFDFEWTNRNLMYGAYKRTVSYFENSDMEAKGLPSEAEKALLEPFRDKLPADVFGEPLAPPASDGSGQDRNLLRRAVELLTAAGCQRKDGVLRLPDGRPLELEFLDFSSALERHTQPFIKNLRLIGVNARIRVVDAAQYKQRLDDFDFDVMTERIRISFSPGEELRALFGSQAAKIKGSRNLAGVADEATDALIEKALVANSREELVTICRALDRVLRAGRYWIPHWYKASHWIAHWDIFGRPERAPRYDPGVIATWWWDEEKAHRINFAGR